MGKYTAPYRTSRRRRSLRHSTKILSVTAVLLVMSLLVVAKAPVGAAPSNNPTFATIQDMQNAISTALAPIQSAIADLQTQQAKQASQISSLQNATSKTLKVYDTNGQELGIVTTYDGSNDTIYSPTLARFIYLHISDQSLDGTFSPNGSANYQSNNCTGTPYINIDQTSAYNSLFAGPDNFYIVPSSETPSTITTNSVKYWDSEHNQFSCCPSPTCTFGGPVTAQVYQLHQVTLPFTVPLALPLQFKYQ
jgi:hypothetical protein